MAALYTYPYDDDKISIAVSTFKRRKLNGPNLFPFAGSLIATTPQTIRQRFTDISNVASKHKKLSKRSSNKCNSDKLNNSQQIKSDLHLFLSFVDSDFEANDCNSSINSSNSNSNSGSDSNSSSSSISSGNSNSSSSCSSSSIDCDAGELLEPCCCGDMVQSFEKSYNTTTDAITTALYATSAASPITLSEVTALLSEYGLANNVDTLYLPLYQQAFVHHSVVSSDAPETSNERMEFIGDGILECVTKCFLYHNFPNEDEGFMTDKKIALVKNTRSVKSHVQCG